MAEHPTHRGLTWQDMPGYTLTGKKLTFALFRRAQWPPRRWHVPAQLTGPALALLLEERRAMMKGHGRKAAAAMTNVE